MSILSEILQYTTVIHFSETEEVVYLPTQIGNHIIPINHANVDLEEIDVILVGCGELRGQNRKMDYSNGPDCVRKELYKLHYWHEDVRIGDIGNIIEGAQLNDTKAALRTVLTELHHLGKKVIVIGGSHDLTLQQYDVYKTKQEIIDFTVIDMLADLDDVSENRYDSYLMEALTFTPNYVRHFNLIGFQSYYVNPHLIETFDKLRFDCTRLGKAREDLDEMEPALRSSHIVSIDINAIRYSDAPANKLGSPNGFYGDEMCKITRFAGMSDTLGSLGIYGYLPELDNDQITAKLIAQMVWYFIDGVSVQKLECTLSDKDQFIEYHITFTHNNSLFLKSKRTNRWWMQLPNESFIPCSYKDYITACNNEIPERWMREVERLV
jgi:arginase family enzyme